MIGVYAPGRDCTDLLSFIKSYERKIPIDYYEKITDKEKITFLLLWKSTESILKSCKNIRVVMSFGAGVDFLNPYLSILKGVKVLRFSDPYLSNEVASYIFTAIMNHKKNLIAYKELNSWKPIKDTPLNDINVGIFGLGRIGKVVSELLALVGVRVTGFGKTQRNGSQGAYYSSRYDIEKNFSKLDYIVNILPLTSETKEFFDEGLLSLAKPTAYFINVGRGKTINEGVLSNKLSSHKLAGACLDVFEEEPLPIDSPLWKMKQVLITPHCAGITNWKELALQVHSNYNKMVNGDLIPNQIDYKKGY